MAAEVEAVALELDRLRDPADGLRRLRERSPNTHAARASTPTSAPPARRPAPRLPIHCSRVYPPSAKRKSSRKGLQIGVGAPPTFFAPDRASADDARCLSREPRAEGSGRPGRPGGCSGLRTTSGRRWSQSSRASRDVATRPPARWPERSPQRPSRRLPASERDWVRRVEGRRRELAADGTAVAPSFDAGSGAVPGGLLQERRTDPDRRDRRGVQHPDALGDVPDTPCPRARAGDLASSSAPASGISSAYQAAALELNGRGELTTLEGARAWAEVAEQGLSSLGLAERCRVEVGPIDETLDARAGADRPDRLRLPRRRPQRGGDREALRGGPAAHGARRRRGAGRRRLQLGHVAGLDDDHQRERVTVRLALGRMGVLAVD